MKQLIVLTKNIFAEMKLQEKLQLLGYEVFVSNYILEALLQKKNLSCLNNFRIVIFGESVSNEEMIQILAMLPKNIFTFRIDEATPTAERKEFLESKGLNNWLQSNMSINELRETLADIIFCEVVVEHESVGLELTSQKLHNLVFSLSGREKRIFKLLLLADGQKLTRHELSTHLWNGEVTNSTLSQLSQSIKLIRRKMDRFKINKNLLQTEWRSGYALSSEIANNLDAETQELLFEGAHSK